MCGGKLTLADLHAAWEMLEKEDRNNSFYWIDRARADRIRAIAEASGSKIAKQVAAEILAKFGEVEIPQMPLRKS